MQFRLRSLFVLMALVAVLLTWYARSLGWVHERDALAQAPGIALATGDNRLDASLPLMWQVAGARPVRQIMVHPSVTDEFLARLQAAFPEAEIHRESSGRGIE